MGKSKQRHRHAAEEKAAAAQQREVDYAHGNWHSLTGLRGLAAAGVLLFHVQLLAGNPPLPAPLAWLCAIGWSGVDVFFTLSAFLLSLPFVEALERGASRPSLRDYWRHRAWRVLPAYWVQVLLLFVFAIAGVKASNWAHADAASLAVNSLFLYDLHPFVPPALPPWWTLPVELGFYLVLPLFARLLTPSRWPWLLVAMAASLAWAWGIQQLDAPRSDVSAWANHLPGRLHQFLVGMLAAWVLIRWRARLAPLSSVQRDAIATAAIVLFLALPAIGIPVLGRPYDGSASTHWSLAGWHLLASLLVAALLLALASGPSRIGQWLGAGWLRALGLVSYSLYLWHYPVMLALRESLGGQQAVGAQAGGFVFQALLFSLLAAAASWWIVERPAQQYARRDKMPAFPARA
jgi:peptidoglycan/LPS O-acetylase OafA/YrhL